MPKDLQFTTPDQPARNICELVDYIGKLSQVRSDQTFVYRGQIKEYSSAVFPDSKFPLVPSKLRPWINATSLPRIIDEAPVPFGNKYYRIYPLATFGDIVAHWINTGGHRLPMQMDLGIDASHLLVKGILKLSDVVFETISDGIGGNVARPIDMDSDLAITLDNALREIFRHVKEQLAAIKYRDPFHDMGAPLSEAVSLVHKEAFVYCVSDGLYPYPMGQYIAQQYGFRSFYLDVTTKIEVAAFFATHDSPHYSRPETEGIGVIKVFDITALLGSKLGEIYFCGEDVFPPFETPGLHIDDLDDILPRYYAATLACKAKDMTKEEGNTYLKFPSGAYVNSRMGRQGSAMIRPQMLQSSKTGPADGVEDLSSRASYTPFYFRHSATDLVNSRITREYLWPNESDVYWKVMNHRMLHWQTTIEKCNSNERVEWVTAPRRLDLVDPGFKA